MKTILYFSLALAGLSGMYGLQLRDGFDASRLPDPITQVDFRTVPSQEKVELGRLLFFDKILSGNKNISCSTCHHPEFGSSDGLALGFGEGATGNGQVRGPGTDIETGVHERVPRNSPALFNLGAIEFTKMFHDGRVEVDTNAHYASGFISPAKWKLPEGLDNVIAAQAMFPVTSPTEMAGQKGENDVADAASLHNAAGPGGIWEILSERLQAIPEYRLRFKRAYPDKIASVDDITYVLAANAIAAFEVVMFQFTNSPFDDYLETGKGLTWQQERGMRLFYGRANCSTCHSGKFQTDQEFHAIAMPQIGPGKSDGNDPTYWQATGQRAFPEDFGRGRVTFRPEDNYKFRTPSLRNVELTGPWGHSGAYDELIDVVRHHANPEKYVAEYELSDMTLPEMNSALEITADGPKLNHRWMSEQRFEEYALRDGWVQGQGPLKQKLAGANDLEGVELSERDIQDITAFLTSLTDPRAKDLSMLVPESVPSGLPVGD